jgi:division protein CdvB (Snf7/Vps24/ESCRT-III family)
MLMNDCKKKNKKKRLAQLYTIDNMKTKLKKFSIKIQIKNKVFISSHFCLGKKKVTI